MKLYVDFEKPRTVKEFLIKFYTLRHEECKGYNYGRNIPCVTYYDKECKELQSSHTRRSFDDLYSLITTYYHSITEKKLLHYLLTFKVKNYNNNNNYCKCFIGICEGSKIVKYMPVHCRNYIHTLNDEKNIYDKKLANSKHTCKSLLALLDIKTPQEYHNYIANH